MPDYQVHIRKGIAYVSHFDTEKGKRVEKKKTEQVLSDVLQFKLHELTETTFGEFFSFIIRERELMEKIFSAAMYGHPIEPYIAEVAQPPGDPEQLEKVEVHWGAEIDGGDFSMFPAFHGWGKLEPQEGLPEQPVYGGYAIEFTPLYEYKMLPLVLDTKFEIWDMQKPEKPVITAAECEFTVYDVLKAILWEITWAGDISKGRGECPACEKHGPCPRHKEEEPETSG
jgi:hypothetical protein